MELSVVKPGNEAAGTVAVSEARVRERRRHVLKSLVVVRSRGVRKAQVAPVRARFGRPSGDPAV